MKWSLLGLVTMSVYTTQADPSNPQPKAQNQHMMPQNKIDSIKSSYRMLNTIFPCYFPIACYAQSEFEPSLEEKKPKGNNKCPPPQCISSAAHELPKILL